MTKSEFEALISNKDDLYVEYKKDFTCADDMAIEIIAFSNDIGGKIILGIDNSLNIIGLSSEDIQRLNKMLSASISERIMPPVYPSSEIFEYNNKKIMIVNVPDGRNKPYGTKDCKYIIRRGTTKRLLTDTNEILRLYQSSGRLYADEMEIYDTSINDVSERSFENYFKSEFKKGYSEMSLNFEQALKNNNVLRNGKLTLAGLLFFAKEPQLYKPAFCIKAVSFFGNSLGGKEYRDSVNITGKIPEIFEEGIRFFTRNLKHTQQEQKLNTTGKLEISEVALKELLQNALIHRDYFRNSPIRLIIFNNRIEIISPGKLPNGLSIENIKMGIAGVRNNLLASYGAKLMLYRGYGTGITRALEEQPNIEFINDIEGEQFIVKIPRPETDN